MAPDTPRSDVGVQASSSSTARQAITKQTSSAPDISREARKPSGVFPEVLRTTGCTGTLIAPRAILSAAHCSADNPDVGWPDNTSEAFSQISTTTLGSPYFRKKFSINHDSDQVRGHVHDLEVHFVSDSNTTKEMDSQYINKHFRMSNPKRNYPVDGRVPLVDPTEPVSPDLQRAVAVRGGPTDTARREFIDFLYDSSYHGANGQQYAMDRYDYQGGDSGGPTILSETVSASWASSYSTIEYNRRVGSVHKGTDNGIGIDNPLSTNAIFNDNSYTLNNDQEEAARINQQWVRAVASDADGDGWPALCDTDPSAASSTHNRCTPRLGSWDKKEPRGMLKCAPGFAMTGLRGRASDVIDKLAVRCTPTTCLQENRSSCAEEYWTEHFAGEGGNDSDSDDGDGGGTKFSETCSNGYAITDIAGHDDSDMLYSIRARCYEYTPLTQNTWNYGQELGPFGNDYGNLSQGTDTGYEWCDYEAMRGFEARSKLDGDQTLSWLTGLQPICNSKDSEESQYYGNGSTSWMGKRSCPRGMIGVGFAGAKDQSDTDDLGLVGLLCMKKSRVANGESPQDSELMIAHGDYKVNGVRYPYMTEKYSKFEQRHGLGSDLKVQKCASGEAVIKARFYRDTSDDQLTWLRYFECDDGGGSWNDKNLYTLDAGSGGDAAKWLQCDDKNHAVRSLVMDDDSGTNGVALRCGDRN